MTRYRDPNGNLHDPYTDDGDVKPEFWRYPTLEEIEKHGELFGSGCGDGIHWISKDWGDGLGYRAKISYLPEGWSEVEIPTSKCKTFAEFCVSWYGHEIVPFGEQPDLIEKHKYGYTVIDADGNVIKTIDRTNPNRRWDYYQIGGRWNGFFKIKPQTLFAVIDRPGLQQMNSDYKPPTEDRADICMKSDIDIEGMRQEAENEARKKYDLVHSIIDQYPVIISWEECQQLNLAEGFDKEGKPHVNWDAAQKQYKNQPAVMALRENHDTMWFEADEFLISREDYLRQARERALCTFAVVKDSQWYARGRMGWWAMVSNEKEYDEWNAQFALLIDELPNNTLLTIVDCHV